MPSLAEGNTVLKLCHQWDRHRRNTFFDLIREFLRSASDDDIIKLSRKFSNDREAARRWGTPTGCPNPAIQKLIIAEIREIAGGGAS